MVLAVMVLNKMATLCHSTKYDGNNVTGPNMMALYDTEQNIMSSISYGTECDENSLIWC